MTDPDEELALKEAIRRLRVKPLPAPPEPCEDEPDAEDGGELEEEAEDEPC